MAQALLTHLKALKNDGAPSKEEFSDLVRKSTIAP